MRRPEPERLDWPELMRIGIGRLRLPPAVFWDLTPHELTILTGRDAGCGPLDRAALVTLMRRHPDLPKE